MRGVIIANGYYKSAEYKRHIQAIQVALSKQDLVTKVYYNRKPLDINQEFSIDYAIMLDADYSLASILEKSNCYVFNNANAIETVTNKTKLYLSLSKIKGVSIPGTTINPYKVNNEIDDTFNNWLMNLYGSPVVIKSNKTKQVYLAKSYSDLHEICKSINDNDIIFQKCNTESKGKIYRLFLINKKVVETVLIKNSKDFNATNKRGRKIELVTLSKEYINMAQKVAEELNLDYATVDMFVNKPIVCSVNLNTNFDFLNEISDINIANLYAEHIKTSLKTRIEEDKLRAEREKKYMEKVLRGKKPSKGTKVNKSTTKQKK